MLYKIGKMSGLGEYLRAWRGARGLSLGGVALRAGVHKSTLSRWESGAQQPRLAELAAVLDVLNIGPAERAEALACLQNPRAAQTLRGQSRHSEVTFPLAATLAGGGVPTGGDLLRALRLRRGWTQERVAAATGVSQSLVARWERGEAWPAPADLQTLCQRLGARGSEVVALTRGCLQGNEAQGIERTGRVSLDLLERYRVNYAVVVDGAEDGLRDLRFLSLQASLWHLALRCETHAAQTQKQAAWRLLAGSYARYAQFLAEQGRCSEARENSERALSLAQHTNLPAGDWLCAVPIHAAALVYCRATTPTRAAARAGARFLQRWASCETVPSRFRAWITSNLGEYIVLGGQPANGLRMAGEACQIAADDSDGEHWFRCRDRVRLLLLTGEPNQALAHLPPPPPTHRPERLLKHSLMCADALLASGNGDEARQHIHHARALITAYNVSDQGSALIRGHGLAYLESQMSPNVHGDK